MKLFLTCVIASALTTSEPKNFDSAIGPWYDLTLPVATRALKLAGKSPSKRYRKTVPDEFTGPVAPLD